MCIHIRTVSLSKYYISMYALHIYIYMCMYVSMCVCVCVAHMLRQTSMTYFPEM